MDFVKISISISRSEVCRANMKNMLQMFVCSTQAAITLYDNGIYPDREQLQFIYAFWVSFERIPHFETRAYSLMRAYYDTIEPGASSFRFCQWLMFNAGKDMKKAVMNICPLEREHTWIL